MSDGSTSPPSQPTTSWGAVLSAAGIVYLALGVILGIGHFIVGVESSLFPTGWIYPAVLLGSGALMTMRRRFDIVISLLGAFTLAVFLLAVSVYVNVLELGLDDPTAFDASIIAAAFALVPLVLRPAFRG